jgi:hypothetical protein
MGKHLRVAVVAGLVVAVVAVTGCQRIAEQATKAAVEKATGVKVEGDKVTVTGKDGQQATLTGGDKKLPPDLPKDFPVYAGQAEGGSQVVAGGESNFTFSVTTKDPVKDVVAWYKEKLPANGWSIENSSTVAVDSMESGSFSAKKDKAEAIITIGGDKSKGDNVSVMVILNVKK